MNGFSHLQYRILYPATVFDLIHLYFYIKKQLTQWFLEQNKRRVLQVFKILKYFIKLRETIVPIIHH